MEIEKAIECLMRTVKYERLIPDEFQGFLPRYFRWMAVVGFDERGKYIGKNISEKRKRPVCELNNLKYLLEIHPTVRQAAKKTHHNAGVIYDCIKSGKCTSEGHYWTMLKNFRETY